MMFSAALDHWPLVERRMRQAVFAGSLRVYGAHPESEFHYAGGFYWANLAKLGNKAQDVDGHFWGSELFPGRHCGWQDAGLLFQPQGTGVYDWYMWTPKLQAQWDRWLVIHRALRGTP